MFCIVPFWAVIAIAIGVGLLLLCCCGCICWKCCCKGKKGKDGEKKKGFLDLKKVSLLGGSSKEKVSSVGVYIVYVGYVLTEYFGAIFLFILYVILCIWRALCFLLRPEVGGTITRRGCKWSKSIEVLLQDTCFIRILVFNAYLRKNILEI